MADRESLETPARAPARSAGTDTIVYGVALVVALIALGLAIANGMSSEEEGPEPAPADPVAAARARAERETRGSEIALEVPDEPPARPDFVPSLPAVPDLATQPPPPRPDTPEDPRMATLAAEMRILSRARTLLGEHPAEAFGVVEEHRRRFAQGVLREEREVFAIEALLALERSAEAERRYYDFVRDFPRSDHRDSLERAMLRPPHRVGAGGR
ncbi:MAG: hypothetical protein KF729_25955 [Sandaracinaceae bacterium]|nr:hypothetical protein [Sandaracinaceae bacterium]